MHALAAQGREQKRKACINFTQMNLFNSKWYCNGNTLPHNWNLWFSYVIILVQCNFFMSFQSIVIHVHYHNKFPKFVCNVIDLCTTSGHIIKIIWSFPLKTNICDERVCSKETSGTALTHKHSSHHCVAEWGMSGFNGASKRIWKFELSPWTPVPVRVSVAPTPSAFGKTGQGNGIRESTHCSASLRATDYDHHKCQALTYRLEITNTGLLTQMHHQFCEVKIVIK